MIPKQFVSRLRPHAVRTQAKIGVPWQALVAQAALETGWLNHPTKDLATGSDSYNLFNIKWTGVGAYVTIKTSEYVKGRKVLTTAKFRKYDSYEESFDDYAKFIAGNARYGAALAVAHDPHRYVLELEKAGYATDPQYAEKLIAIMKRYMGD